MQRSYRVDHLTTERVARGAQPLQVMLAAMVLVLLVAAALVGGRMTQPQTAMQVVAVQPGQTLWEIARQHRVGALSTAETAELIAEANGMSAVQVPERAALKVPARPTGAVASR